MLFIHLLFIYETCRVECCELLTFTDGPLENLSWGGEAKYKKNIRAREN